MTEDERAGCACPSSRSSASSPRVSSPGCAACGSQASRCRSKSVWPARPASLRCCAMRHGAACAPRHAGSCAMPDRCAARRSRGAGRSFEGPRRRAGARRARRCLATLLLVRRRRGYGVLCSRRRNFVDDHHWLGAGVPGIAAASFSSRDFPCWAGSRRSCPRRTASSSCSTAMRATLVAGAAALRALLEGGDAVAAILRGGDATTSTRPTTSRARCCWPCGAPSSPPSTAATSRT